MADGRGISYYIPPEFRRMGKSAMDLLSAIDPVQGIMRGMAASGRAFDSKLPADERKAAAIEAGVETLFPLGMIGMGAAAKQPAKAVLMDILTPTGATKDIAEDTLADPSRRKFIQGAAAAVPVAAVAPDVITDVFTKATKAGGKAAINPLDMALKNLKVLRGQMDEQYQILDELEGMGVGAERSADLANAANKSIQTAEMEMVDVAREAIEDADPAVFSQASDEAIEEIIGMQYESIYANQAIIPEHPNYEIIAKEIKRRGMDVAKDKNGIDRFPNARVFADDIFEPTGLGNIILPKRSVDDDLLDSIGVYRDDGNLNMARQTPPDIEEDILNLKLTELRRQIEQADRVMRADGKTTKEIDEFKAQKRREMFELQNLPPDMDDFYAQGGLVSGVGSLNRRARDMFRGPKGIESLSRFANGGEATMSPREASEHMADVEYEQQILSTADDPLVRMGFDPSVARVTTRADSYSPTMDRLNISAYSGLMSPEIQAHEFRHRGLEILLNDYIKLEPFTFRKKYGPDAWKLAQKLWEQSRLGKRPEDVADSVQEQVAELFQKPASVSRTEYYSSDGRVFQSKDAVEEYIRQNPDLEYEANTVTRNLDDDLETPRVLEFRDYMINKNRGESPSRDPYFEGVLGFQEAASDALAGKYFGYANGGSVVAAKQASVDDLANLATKIRENYGFDPVSLALEIGIDPELALRLVFQESRGKQSAGSEKGARGLTQLMPGTAEEMGVDIDDARDNFIGGMKYLKKMTDRFGLELGLAAYNAGPGNVAKYDGVPPFKETQDYLRIILEPFQGASVQPLLETGAENYLMSQPVAAEGEYSLRPRLRPQYMPTEPMLRPRLRPDEEETAQTTPYMGVIPGKRTNLFEKYGGITSLTNP